jgi:hypothetical protein
LKIGCKKTKFLKRLGEGEGEGEEEGPGKNTKFFKFEKKNYYLKIN